MVNTRNGTDTNANGNYNNANRQNNGPNPNANGQLGVQDLAQMMQAFIATATTIPQQQGELQPPRGSRSRDQLLDTFCKRHPPTFYGDPNPAAAEAWLKQISKFLDVLNINNAEDRIALATFQMQGEADHWWDLVKTTHNVETMTWARFKENFLDKYFPTPVQQAMIQEFLDLEQDSMSVTQYASRFEELARHATSVVPTDAARARRFEWGFSRTIRSTVMSQEYPTYAQVVKCALMMERESVDSMSISKYPLKKVDPLAGGPIRDKNAKFFSHGPYMRNDQSSSAETSLTDTKIIKCFNCGQIGHYKRKCPHPFGIRNFTHKEQPHLEGMEDMAFAIQGAGENLNPFA